MAFHDPNKPYKKTIKFEFLTDCDVLITNSVGVFFLDSYDAYVKTIQREAPDEWHETGTVMHEPNFPFHWPNRSFRIFSGSREETNGGPTPYSYSVGVQDPNGVHNIGSILKFRGFGRITLRDGWALITVGNKTWEQKAPYFINMGDYPK